jgi:Arc/MetJ-type ribon-helix-helix transcriptional regulator
MRTIAVSIDEASLAAVDRLVEASGRRKTGIKAVSRSEVVRQALQEFLARHRRRAREDRDREILAAHRDEIEHQVAALFAEQAEL